MTKYRFKTLGELSVTAGIYISKGGSNDCMVYGDTGTKCQFLGTVAVKDMGREVQADVWDSFCSANFRSLVTTEMTEKDTKTMISMTKKYRYRNGLSARVLCIDGVQAQPVVSMDAKGTIRRHCCAGMYFEPQRESVWDLVEVKQKVKCWVNVYKDGITYAFNSRQDADNAAMRYVRVACIYFEKEIEDGEGLNV